MKALRRIDVKILRDHVTKQRYQGDEAMLNRQRMDNKKNERTGRTQNPHGN